MDLKSTLYVLLAVSAGIAAFMEIYKKRIRKDKAKELEIWMVAWVMSVALSLVAYISFSLQGSPFAIILYSAGVYICQYYFDMKLIKKVVRAWVKSKGITLEGFKHDE